MKGDDKITDNQTIVEEFNSFFSNIATKIKANHVQRSNEHFSSFVLENCQNSIFLKPTNETEIVEIVKHFKASKSTGFDGISQAVIKQVIYFITKPLVHIINLLFSSGRVPKDMKIGNNE